MKRVLTTTLVVAITQDAARTALLALFLRHARHEHPESSYFDGKLAAANMTACLAEDRALAL